MTIVPLCLMQPASLTRLARSISVLSAIKTTMRWIGICRGNDSTGGTGGTVIDLKEDSNEGGVEKHKEMANTT